VVEGEVQVEVEGEVGSTSPFPQAFVYQLSGRLRERLAIFE